MAKKLMIIVLGTAVLAGIGAFEWRYSDDMQDHIKQVNSDLYAASADSSQSTGLAGMLQSMTNETEVGREIIETHEHVHTLKDEVLAWKIKHAIDRDGITVGGAVQIAIRVWRENF